MSSSAMRPASWRCSRNIAGVWSCAFVRSTVRPRRTCCISRTNRPSMLFTLTRQGSYLPTNGNDAARAPQFSLSSGLPRVDLRLGDDQGCWPRPRQPLLTPSSRAMPGHDGSAKGDYPGLDWRGRSVESSSTGRPGPESLALGGGRRMLGKSWKFWKEVDPFLSFGGYVSGAATLLGLPVAAVAAWAFSQLNWFWSTFQFAGVLIVGLITWLLVGVGLNLYRSARGGGEEDRRVTDPLLIGAGLAALVLIGYIGRAS